MRAVPALLGRAWALGGHVCELLRIVDGRGAYLDCAYGPVRWRVDLELYRRVLRAKGILRLPLWRMV